MTAASASAPPWAVTARVTRSLPPDCMDAQATTTSETASDTASIVEKRFMGSPSREVWVAAQYPGARGTVKPAPPTHAESVILR